MEPQEKELKLYGLIAEFDSSDDLLIAAEKVRDAGYEKMDAHVPFPVHGLTEALGIPRTRLPYIVLCGAILGGFGGFMLQYWVSVIAYPLNIGGRPYFSWPSFVPIIFECTILGAGVTTFLALLGLNKLPQHYHPVFEAKNFERASGDGFFLCIEAADKKFDAESTRSLLQEAGPKNVTEVMAEEL